MQVDGGNDNIHSTGVILKTIKDIFDKGDRLSKGVVGFPVPSNKDFVSGKTIFQNEILYHRYPIFYTSSILKSFPNITACEYSPK